MIDINKIIRSKNRKSTKCPQIINFFNFPSLIAFPTINPFPADFFPSNFRTKFCVYLVKYI